MNCRIGDLAFITGARLACNEGVLVQVVRRDGRRNWWVKSMCGPRPATDGQRRAMASVPDDCLKPMRGARKEMRQSELTPPA